MRRIEFVRHLSPGRLRIRFRSSNNPTERARWHALWLLSRRDEPRTPAQVADVVGLSAVAVRAILHRWNALGPESVVDGRRSNGPKPRLSPRQRGALATALGKRPPDGGLWTGPKVARYVADRWGVEVGKATGWRWLRDLGFTIQVPRPSHPRSAGPEARRRWKKTWPSASSVCGRGIPAWPSRCGRRTRRGWG